MYGLLDNMIVNPVFYTRVDEIFRAILLLTDIKVRPCAIACVRA